MSLILAKTNDTKMLPIYSAFHVGVIFQGK
jgi:hypothetical protein